MDAPKRQFLGGVKNITPENTYKREQANYQSGIVSGLNADFFNKIFGLTGWLDFYSRSQNVSDKEEFLMKALDSIRKIPTYRDHFKNDMAYQNASADAAFASDILPYIESIDEIVLAIQDLGEKTRAVYLSEGLSQHLEYCLSRLRDSAGLVERILRPAIDRVVGDESVGKDLDTHPMFFKGTDKPQPSEQEALDKIAKRLEFAVQLLEKGPLGGSFSHLRKDGNVTPIGWEPTEEDRKKLEGSES